MAQSTQTIVVAVDYSDPSVAAVDLALAQAEKSTSVRLVPVLVLSGGPATRPTSAVQSTGDFLTSAKSNLSQLVEDRHKRRGSTSALPPVEPHVVFGPPARRVVEIAEEQKADLVVVGTHGRQGVEHLVLGSVAEDIVRRAPCSVLVARDRQVISDADQVAAAAASEHAAEAAQSDETRSTETAEHSFDHVVSEPHIEDGRVVLHVVEEHSGRVFACSFLDFDRVSVEPLEREWVANSSGEQRARAAKLALEYSRAEQGLFEQLFEELERRG